MSRVLFDNQPAAPQPNTGRADVACFVGLVRLLAASVFPPSILAAAASSGLPLPASALTASVLSPGLVAWLLTLGYKPGDIAALTNVPIPIESYAAFTALFDDGSAGFGTDYVAVTVRSFFAQGGKKAYIVRTDDPLAPSDDAMTRAQKLAGLLVSPAYDAGDATTWTGVGALTTLEDVSFLLLPDLPAVCDSQPLGAVGQVPTAATGPQEFAVCSPASIVPRQYRTFASPAPRLSVNDYSVWANTAAEVLNFLAMGAINHLLHLREMQFVAAFPLPQDVDAAAAAEQPSSAEIAQDIHDVITAQLPESLVPVNSVPPGNISTCFLQLAYPWLKTSGSGMLLESLEPPDGALAGLLARNALTRGTFLSATKITPAEIYDVYPQLPMQDTRSSAQPIVWGVGAATRPLIERLSLFGFTPTGLRLLSDVTAYPGESYRPGAVNRMVGAIARAARRMGESHVFDSNGPNLWGRVQRSLQNLFLRLWTLGALDGDSPADAFSVRCDRTTMTQNDLDNGRMTAVVTFSPAALLETITVTLAIESSGTSVQEISANLSSPNVPATSNVGVN
jgi:uncharacterized protein